MGFDLIATKPHLLFIILISIGMRRKGLLVKMMTVMVVLMRVRTRGAAELNRRV